MSANFGIINQDHVSLQGGLVNQDQVGVTLPSVLIYSQSISIVRGHKPEIKV